MIKKTLIFICLFGTILFGATNGVLKPDEAFSVDIQKAQNGLKVDVKLGKEIYIYKDKFAVTLTKPIEKNLNSEIELPKSEAYHDYDVFRDDFYFFVPYEIIEKYAKNNPYNIDISWQGCSQKGLCYRPMSKSFSLKNALSEQNMIANSIKNSSFFWVLLTFFGFGVLLSLTPCIFPIIPILSSIIVSNSDKKMSAKSGFWLSFVYVFSMALTYAIVGVLAGLSGENLQASLQNPYVLSFFSLIFVALALSMFGFYDLQLPSFLQSFADKKSQNMRGKGIFGVSVMGFLSALIVGPCITPPLAGALIYIAQSGNWIVGGSSLFALGMGMGVPLLIIGMSAGKFLPKPGVWMDNVKAIFGVVMLGVAIYFISRVLPSEVSLLLWAVLFIFCGVYLGALESASKGGWARFVKSCGVVFLVYGITLFVGTLSGGRSFTHPFAKTTNVQKSPKEYKLVSSNEELNEILCNANKPVIVDFWATWCTYCVKMDKDLFDDKRVKEALRDFILVRIDVTKNSLEDRKILKRFKLFTPPAILFFSGNKELKNLQIVGYKNADEFLDILKVAKYAK